MQTYSVGSRDGLHSRALLLLATAAALGLVSCKHRGHDLEITLNDLEVIMYVLKILFEV